MFNKVPIANLGRKAGRPAVAVAALLCIAAGGPPSGSPSPATGPVGALAPGSLPVERAIAAFRALCMDTFPDAGAIARAAQASDLGFMRVESGWPGRRQWVANAGTLTFDGFEGLRATADGPAMASCELQLAMGDGQSARNLTARIGRGLAPGRRRVERNGSAMWNLGGNGVERLEYVPASPSPREHRLIRRGRLSARAR